MAVERAKTTVYLDPALLRAVKVLAAGTGQRESEVFEEALRQFLQPGRKQNGRAALRGLLKELDAQPRRRARATAPLDEQTALDLAYTELRAARRAGHPAPSS